MQSKSFYSSTTLAATNLYHCTTHTHTCHLARTWPFEPAPPSNYTHSWLRWTLNIEHSSLYCSTETYGYEMERYSIWVLVVWRHPWVLTLNVQKKIWHSSGSLTVLQRQYKLCLFGRALPYRHPWQETLCRAKVNINTHNCTNWLRHRLHRVQAAKKVA